MRGGNDKNLARAVYSRTSTQKHVPRDADTDHPDDAAASLKGKGETIRVDRRVARNAPCPCGSGKKSKRCCGG